MICKTIKFDFEAISDDISITKVSEKLDFKSLLERSAAGIIDLRQFQLPRTSDLSVPASVSDAELQRMQMQLLDEPPSVVNNLFGASVEDAEKEASRHMEVMRNNRKITEKNDPEKNDPEKNDPEKNDQE